MMKNINRASYVTETLSPLQKSFIRRKHARMLSFNNKTAGVHVASSNHFFFFNFFTTFSFFHSPRRSFLLVPPSSSSLLPPCSSFFLVQHCLNRLESIKGRFSSISTKALRTDGPTNQRTNGRTMPLIEMRRRI